MMMKPKKTILPHQRAAAYIRLPGIFILALMLITVGMGFLHNAGRKPDADSIEFLLSFMAFLSALSAVFFVTASAVKRRRPWGRVAAVLLSVCLLAAFPLGTAIGAMVLYNLCHTWEDWSNTPTASDGAN